MGVDVLVVGLGATSGLRAAEEELVDGLRRGGAATALARAVPPPEVRTLALTDLVWARAARLAALDGIARHEPRVIVYCTVTAALLWPRPGAIRYDAPAAANRPGRHGAWQRPLERRRLREATLLIAQTAWTLDESPPARADAIVLPIPVEPTQRPVDGLRDVPALSYAPDARKKNLDVVLAAWAAARRDGEVLVVTGRASVAGDPVGVQPRGTMGRDAHRALLRRTQVVVNAARREDYGVVQLEALADGCRLVTAASPGPYAALPLARALDRRLVVEDPADRAALARAIRTALDDPLDDYAERAAALLEPYSRASVDRTIADDLLPRLLRDDAAR